MKKILELMKKKMKELELDYHFQENRSGEITYPYFVGELIPVDNLLEDGMREYSFILSGFDRAESYAGLFDGAEKVESIFPANGYVELYKNQCIAIWGSEPEVIPTGNEELKKIEQKLMIKTWKG